MSANYAFYLVETIGVRFESNVIEDNQGTPLMAYGLYAGTDTADIHMLNNLCIGASNANPYSHSVANNILGRGNRITRSSLIGAFTIHNLASGAVNNPNIINATLTDCISTVIVNPLNIYAAKAESTAQKLYMGAAVAGTSFTMWTADGGNLPDQDHIYAYEIIQ